MDAVNTFVHTIYFIMYGLCMGLLLLLNLLFLLLLHFYYYSIAINQ